MARIRRSRPDEVERLFRIWQDAVAATHDFVRREDLEIFARHVREDYLPKDDFWVAVDDGNRPLAFMGMTGSQVDSLFVDPAHHGGGIGTALMDHARSLFASLDVDVNEQNKGAVAFYRRLGFEPVGRSELDETGRPYPILHLQLKA